MTTEIQKEIHHEISNMDRIILNQDFKVKDAKKFLDRATNILRSLEDMEKSRDRWKRMYLELKGDKDEKIEK